MAAASHASQARVYLSFNNLGRRYGSHWALESASGCARSGEIMALTGENGSGKSTLLLTLANILKPHRGSLTIASGARVHLVAHHPMAYTDLTIAHNLELSALLDGSDKRRIPEALAYWRIDDLQNKTLNTLSRGQVQRFLLARAMLAKSDVLLLDEPFTGLDAYSEALLQNFMTATARRDAAVVFSEHNASRARSLSDKSIRMESGRTMP